MHRVVTLFLALVCLLLAPAAHARDWFVRAGSSGDGSRQKPFGDPWMALERVEANDRVHVAAGRYFGKLERGNWELQFPGVELLGGYDAEFRERNPWKHLTELTWRKGSPNRPDVSLARISTSTQRDTAGATIDGFFIDMQDYYEYAPPPDANFDPKALMRNGAVDLAKGGVLRNCLIVNSINAVRASPGAVVENNVIVNSIYAAVISKRGGNQDPPVTIRDNTIAFVWATKAIAEGGTEGAGIDVTSNAIVEGNVIIHSDNHGAQVPVPAKVQLNGNAFWRNLYSNVTFYYEGKKSSLDDTDIGEAEDAGFAKAGGNVAVDPQLPFDSAWYERFLRRGALGRKFDARAWEQTRAAAGLPETPGEPLDMFAPAYPPQALAALIAPKNPALKQGARERKLPVTFSTAVAPPPAKSYSRATLAAFTNNPKGYDGRDLEVVIGVQGVTNADSGPSGVSGATHKGVYLVDAKAESRTVGYFRKGTVAERIIDAIPNYGSGPPRDLFVVRGVARAKDGYPKHAIVIDSIEPFEQELVVSERPRGRDWFVRAGESGGDGSRERPFRDPFQAIEKAERGDRIHVTEGEYGGKLKSGKWVIDGKQYLALFGGWDRDFKKRDPWNTPTLLYWPPDSKTSPQGYLLEGNGDHTGLIVDGFVFDRRTLNRYDKDGFIDLNASPDNEHLWLSSPESAVRNCTFVNGAGAAARLSNAVTFENNIVVNVFNDGIKVTGGFGTRPAQLRNNTILFVWNRSRPHEGASASGSGIALGGQVPAVIDGNVFQYIDNFAIKADAKLPEVVLTSNAFFRNWAAVRSTQGTPPPTVDEKSMHLLADLPFKKAEGNVVADGNFEFEPAFYAAWFARTSQVTSRFTAEEWKEIAPPSTEGEPAKPGMGMALDWRKAAKLFPKNTQVKGARPKALEGGN